MENTINEVRIIEESREPTPRAVKDVREGSPEQSTGITVPIHSAIAGMSPTMAAGRCRFSMTTKASWQIASPTKRMIGPIAYGGTSAFTMANCPVRQKKQNSTQFMG
jgi:hypothetical protein